MRKNMTEELSGEFHLLDKAKWKEIPDKKVRKFGDVYLGPKYQEGYEIRTFLKKIEKE